MLKAEGARVTLLGFTVPDDHLQEILAQDPAMPIQTHTLAWGLVKALSAAGCRVTLLSSMPVSTYPRNRRIRFNGGRFTSNGIDGELLGFVNILGIKHLTRFASACLVGLRATARWQSQAVLIHGVHAPFLWFGVLAGRLRGVAVVPMLTDPPGVIGPHDGPVTKFLRRVDVQLVRLALSRCDGVVALTRALAEDFAPGRPYMIMEGILDPPAASPSAQRRHDPSPRDTFEVVYAGGLTREYGVDRLVEMVRGSADPRLRLLLFGRGELEPWLREQSARDGRIHPPELLSRQDLACVLAKADVLVNPRPIDQGFVKYSFPSKLIDYLHAGTPVVTTRLPGIPDDYAGRLIFAEPDTVDGLWSAIDRVMRMPPEQARAFGVGGAEFIQQTRGVQAQGEKVGGFVYDLFRRRQPRSGSPTRSDNPTRSDSALAADERLPADDSIR